MPTAFRNGAAIGPLLLRESTLSVSEDSVPHICVGVVPSGDPRQLYRRFPDGREELHIGQESIPVSDPAVQALNALLTGALDTGPTRKHR